MRSIGLLLLATTVMAQAPTFQPVATVNQLMESIILPTSNAVFNMGREAPKDDKAWLAVQNSALMLAETGNLLMMRTPAEDNDVWIKQSKALVDGGAAAFRAAKAKDAMDLLKASGQVYAACDGCHKQYLDRGGETR